jgi:outer membrane cobalamin receptor
MVKFTPTDKNGAYEFANVRTKYFISATNVGYGKAVSPAFEVSSSNAAVPTLVMSEQAKGMSEVTVTAKKPFVETRIDKTIVNVDAAPTTAGATALEVLEKSPGVTVDNDGNISLRGKAGVIIMIDGRPTYLSSADLAAMLKNMPASAMEQIEIMTNPS